ncbi:DUF397 domain-containing protein [Streptomyces sp. NPDC050448]|uniref:DUF397 domain-containing protein n=1 Tax=Streptomyces sp. NPDC050448 TaxID=3155404 RepID=UPI00343E6654
MCLDAERQLADYRELLNQYQYQWQRPSRCASGDSCVYVAAAPGDHILVAGSGEDAATALLRVSGSDWATLPDGIKARRP